MDVIKGAIRGDQSRFKFLHGKFYINLQQGPENLQTRQRLGQEIPLIPKEHSEGTYIQKVEQRSELPHGSERPAGD